MKNNEKISQDKNLIVGENIQRLRKERNLRNKDVVTQLQLRGVALSTSTLSKIERGNSNPTTQLLVALTDIFHCDFNAFFEGSKESHTEY
ncbi:MAG: helix-turn-helix domain-containing protein [Butyrivibrio sp.]|nr:helix-turn-helix domain-containing protein [Muribaculum sp.]MCM1551375.1 helix-turn-helix domain-containing protein [Butyrivibrio sp.]